MPCEPWVEPPGVRDSIAGATGILLPPTAGNEKERTPSAIESLTPGGSSHGSQGIRLAYQLARDAFLKDGNNRVILATDGDFNVGVSSDGELVRLIEDRRRRACFSRYWALEWAICKIRR